MFFMCVCVCVYNAYIYFFLFIYYVCLSILRDVLLLGFCNIVDDSKYFYERSRALFFYIFGVSIYVYDVGNEIIFLRNNYFYDLKEDSGLSLDKFLRTPFYIINYIGNILCLKYDLFDFLLIFGIVSTQFPHHNFSDC